MCLFSWRLHRAAIPTEPVSLDEWARIQPRGKGPLKGQPTKPHFTSLNNLFLHTGQQVSDCLTREETYVDDLAPPHHTCVRVCLWRSRRCGRPRYLLSRSATLHYRGICGRWSTSSRTASQSWCLRVSRPRVGCGCQAAATIQL